MVFHTPNKEMFTMVGTDLSFLLDRATLRDPRGRAHSSENEECAESKEEKEGMSSLNFEVAQERQTH